MTEPLGTDPERALVVARGPGAPPPGRSGDIDVARLVRGLWRRRFRMALVAILVGGMVGAPLVLLRKDSWQSEALFVLQSVRDSFAHTPLENNVFASADMETAVQLLTVDPIVSGVADHYGLDAEGLLKQVEVFPQDRSRVLVVRATADSAEGAAEMANRYLDVATGYYHDDVDRQIEQAARTAQARVDTARDQVKSTQGKLSKFIKQFDFSDEAELGKAVDRARESERRLDTLVARNAAIDMQLEKVSELLDKEEKVVRSVSSSSGGGTKKGFWERYRSDSTDSPWLAKTGGRRSTTTSTVAPNPIHQSLYMAGLELETEAAALEVQIERGEEELAALRTQEERLPAVKREFQSLQVERDHALEELTTSLTAQGNVAALQRLESPLFQVIERAKPPRKPERTRRIVLGALGVLIGLAVAFGWGVLAELRDHRVREPAEVERLGIPVVSNVYLNGSALSGSAQEGLEQAAYLVRRHGRLFGPQCVLVTSAGPEEGKTRVAREVARILVEWGDSVLRIDANFRDVSGQPGHLERYLSGEAEQPSLLKFRNGLYAITCGGTRSDGPALLASDWMDRLLERSRASFSISVVDGPSVEPGVDAELLAEKVDAVLFVVRRNQASLDDLHRSIQKMRALGATIIGAVMVDGKGRIGSGRDEGLRGEEMVG